MTLVRSNKTMPERTELRRDWGKGLMVLMRIKVHHLPTNIYEVIKKRQEKHSHEKLQTWYLNEIITVTEAVENTEKQAKHETW